MKALIFHPAWARLSIFVLATLLLTATASQAAQAVAESAITPAPREGRPMERFKELNERVRQQQGSIDLVFLGDSITQGWEGAGREVWQKYYGERKALNLGIGGDRTQHVLWRLDNGNADGIQPKVVVLMIGTNNSGENRNSAGEIVEGVAAVVQKIREKFPQARILLLGIFPRGQNFNNQRGQVLQVNQVIRKLADGDRVHYLDFGHLFLEPNGTISKDIMPDSLHLSPRGYSIWAEAIEDTLSALLGDQRVRPDAASAQGADLTGDWIWTMRGPDGNPIEAPLILKQEGDTISGRFSRDETRWLQIENGRTTDQGFSWIVKRDRPDGGVLVYRMSGKLQEGKIEGTVRTDMDGSEVVTTWSARRK